MHPMSNVPTIDRLAPGRRPNRWPIGYQKWRSLLFVHWRAPVAAVRPLLPGRLEIDTFDGTAWVGLVLFYMTGVRPWWSPPVLGLSTFHETNLRTYVHADGVPAVWFFSLDAANSPAVRVARWRWGLAYHRSDMTIRQDYDTDGDADGGVIRYTGRRRWPPPCPADYDVRAEYGSRFPGPAEPDTLDHFLIERYFLYTTRPDGTLGRAQVHHRPYPLREARVTELTETLRAAAGLPAEGPIEHACYCDGVDTEIFPLRTV
jgi:uncharacterized protein YqjF (DUF2071 family)